MPKKNDNSKQMLFADYYVSERFNVTRAAIKAGYEKNSAHSTGSRLLNSAKVQNRIKQRIDETIKDIDYEVARWFEDINAIQGANILDFVSWDKKTIYLKPSKELTREEAYPICTITQITNSAGTRIEVRLEKKLKALELKGRALGLFGDDKALTRKTKKDKQTAEEKRKRISELLNKRKEINDKRKGT